MIIMIKGNEQTKKKKANWSFLKNAGKDLELIEKSDGDGSWSARMGKMKMEIQRRERLKNYILALGVVYFILMIE